MKIEIPDKNANIILKIRNYQLISKVFFSDENIDYTLRKLVERNIRQKQSTGKLYKFPELEEK